MMMMMMKMKVLLRTWTLKMINQEGLRKRTSRMTTMTINDITMMTIMARTTVNTTRMMLTMVWFVLD